MVTTLVRKLSDNRVHVIIEENGLLLWDDIMSDSKFKIYDGYIKARSYKLLEDCGKLSNPYVMFELGGMMWRVDDLDYIDNFRELKRGASPLLYSIEEPITIDLIFDSTMYDFFPYEKNVLVYKYGLFFINGKNYGALKSVCSQFNITESDLDNHNTSNLTGLFKYISYLEGCALSGYVSGSGHSYF